MFVNVLSNFPPWTGETHEVGVCYERHALIDCVKPSKLELVEKLYTKQWTFHRSRFELKLTLPQRLDGDEVG